MDKKDKLLKLCFSIISLPVYWLGSIMIFSNFFNLKSDYQKISSFPKERKQYPPTLLDALIAGEDHRFYMHMGFDPISVIRAFWNVYVRKNRQGGSTIEQQFVRVITNRCEPTLSRKLREIILAVVVSNSFAKEQILTSYLAIAYFGWHMNGINQVFSRFNILSHEVTEEQACSIVARLKYPEPRRASSKLTQLINNRAFHVHQRGLGGRCLLSCYYRLATILSPQLPQKNAGVSFGKGTCFVGKAMQTSILAVRRFSRLFCILLANRRGMP